MLNNNQLHLLNINKFLFIRTTPLSTRTHQIHLFLPPTNIVPAAVSPFQFHFQLQFHLPL